MFSVVIPLYNKAPHIAKAIDSVLKQTVQPVEIIVVDDGSTDGGSSIVKKYACQGVVYVWQENQGESSARNKGILTAKGDYVAFLDADDWWLPVHLEKLWGLIQAFPCAVLYSTAHYIHRGGEVFKPRSPYHVGQSGYVDDFFLRYSEGLSLVNSITACSKRSDLIEVGGFPLGVRRGPDIICWSKLALKGKVAHTEVPTAVYYQDAVNRTDSLREIEPPGSLQFLSMLLKSPDLSPKQVKGIKRLFDRIALFTAAGFCMKGDGVGASSVRKLAFQVGRYQAGFAIGLISCLPSDLLYFARGLRHPKIKSQAQ